MKQASRVFIYAKEDARSQTAAAAIESKLRERSINVVHQYSSAVDFIISVGGDGTYLRMLVDCDYPEVPIAGINTGHLGFFQEFLPDNLDALADICAGGEYSIQKQKLLSAEVRCDSPVPQHYLAVNDIVIKRQTGSVIHLNLSIGSSFIERFSGDGLIISTSAGSTAYNYSLGGSIVDPRVAMLQITPIAPMNTTAFRSFTSSLILPPDMGVDIYPDPEYKDDVLLSIDGADHRFSSMENVRIQYCEKEVSLVRLANYDFWGKVKSKFL